MWKRTAEFLTDIRKILNNMIVGGICIEKQTRLNTKIMELVRLSENLFFSLVKRKRTFADSN